MKHTPGPWSIHKHMSGENVTDCLPDFTAHTIYIGAGDVLLGDFSAFKPASGENPGWPRVTDFEVNRANARLVIAAPDLLEALVSAQEALCDRPLMDPVVAQMRAAIAKATGEQA